MPTSTRYEENETTLLLSAVLALHNGKPKKDPASLYREVVIGKYNAPARADLALINDKHLILIECKGEKDNLSRLPSQVKYYDMIADACYLLCSRCQIEKVKTILPKHWGIIAPNLWNRILVVKKPSPIPLKLYNPYLALEMLWKEDFKAIGYSSTLKGYKLRAVNPDLQFLFDNQDCGYNLKIERWNELKVRHQTRVKKLIRKQICLRLQEKNLIKQDNRYIEGYTADAYALYLL